MNIGCLRDQTIDHLGPCFKGYVTASRSIKCNLPQANSEHMSDKQLH